MRNSEPLTCIASGAVAFYDDPSHTYVNEFGEKYLSGSSYAGMFAHDFNKAMILPKSAKRLGESVDVVDAYWKSKGDIATSFGNAVHNALEHYGKYLELSIKDGKPLGFHPTIQPIVDAFFKGREHETAIYEPFVADELNLECGRIDRLLITGDKRCIIEDYKTNRDLYDIGKQKFLKAPADFIENNYFGKYTLQLNFYQDCFEAAGWIVEDRRIHWWNGKAWEMIPVPRVQKMKPIIAPEFSIYQD